MSDVDLRKLLKNISKIPYVVIKKNGISSGCPWEPCLLKKYESIDFKFNGFKLSVFGGNYGHPDYRKPDSEIKVMLLLSHCVYEYSLKQFMPLVETNTILLELLDGVFLQCANQKELEYYLLGIINS